MSAFWLDSGKLPILRIGSPVTEFDSVVGLDFPGALKLTSFMGTGRAKVSKDHAEVLRVAGIFFGQFFLCSREWCKDDFVDQKKKKSMLTMGCGCLHVPLQKQRESFSVKLCLPSADPLPHRISNAVPWAPDLLYSGHWKAKM